MAYNLPPAWDPGFVLPKNVRDEGLQRRALVTKQMPRGTYDDSTDGTAGYMVPQYVKDEGIGQGAFTTDWQPRGTYNGGKIPHWLNQRPTVTKVVALPGGGKQVTVQALGDAPMAEPFETYGQRAATLIITRFQAVPQPQRQRAMRAFMDTIDKSLWSRTQDIFSRYVREQKMAPADAFPLALARALSTGIAAEIITTGMRRTAPQAASLLGLGCYGCAALLGALGDMPAGPDCPSDPGRRSIAGFQWVYTAGGAPGHWQKTPAGQPDIPFCPTGNPGGAPVDDPGLIASFNALPNPNPDWFVGPFGFKTATFTPRVWATDNVSATTANRASTPDIMYLSPDVNAQATQNLAYVKPIQQAVLDWLKTRLVMAKDATGNPVDTATTYADTASNRHPSSYLFDADGNTNQGQADDAKRWFDAMGIQPGDPVRLHTLWYLKTASEPLARTKHIKTGADMVLVVSLAPMTLFHSWDAKTNPLVLKVWLATVPDKSIFGALWNPMILINPLTALEATASVATGLANELGSLACDVLKNPAAGTAAGVAAAAYGIPPQAGTQGVAIAADQCGKPPPPVKPIVHRSIWPWVLLGGGAIAVVAVLTKKPKKKAP